MLFQRERYKLADSFIIIKLFKLHVELFKNFFNIDISLLFGKQCNHPLFFDDEIKKFQIVNQI